MEILSNNQDTIEELSIKYFKTFFDVNLNFESSKKQITIKQLIEFSKYVSDMFYSVDEIPPISNDFKYFSDDCVIVDINGRFTTGYYNHKTNMWKEGGIDGGINV